jgi:hypothetical protein
MREHDPLSCPLSAFRESILRAGQGQRSPSAFPPITGQDGGTVDAGLARITRGKTSATASGNVRNG